MNVETFLLGVLFTIVTVGLPYVLWRYAYTPFKVCRADILALKLRQESNEIQRQADLDWLRNEIGLRKAVDLSNEELANREMKLRARRLWPSADPNV